jgi:hypothetical protein
MEDVATVSAWAEANFGTARLGDPRRTRRLVDAAAALAAHPEKSLPQVFDWNELRGFYRLCDRTEATLPALQRPHWERTRSAMAQAPLVLILHDTTELDFTSHRALRGAGPIGDNRGRGFLQHNSLAVVPQPRQVLGLAYQQWHVRRPAPAGETSYQRKRRPRESDWWREGMAATGPAPDGTCWVDVADRAGDDYQTLRAARAVGHHFLVRATQNRGVAVAADGPADVYLLDHARSLPAAATDAVVIPGRGGRAGRTAAVCLAAAAVWMPAPAETPRRRSQPVLPLWVIRVWEPDPPAEVDEPLEWILLCSLATATEAELKERRDWYATRWLVEVFHDIEKNGCSQEARRFETGERLAACLAVLSVVAVRVFQLRCALEVGPEEPAERVAGAAEIEVVRRFVGHRGEAMTVREFIRGVARLGGFLGRKGDGEPGVRALWRGCQRLQDMVRGFELHDSGQSDSEQSPICW